MGNWFLGRMPFASQLAADTKKDWCTWSHRASGGGLRLHLIRDQILSSQPCHFLEPSVRSCGLCHPGPFIQAWCLISAHKVDVKSLAAHPLTPVGFITSLEKPWMSNQPHKTNKHIFLTIHPSSNKHFHKDLRFTECCYVCNALFCSVVEHQTWTGKSQGQIPIPPFYHVTVKKSILSSLWLSFVFCGTPAWGLFRLTEIVPVKIRTHLQVFNQWLLLGPNLQPSDFSIHLV